MTTKTSGVLDEVISTAVKEAVSEHLQPLIKELKAAADATNPAAPKEEHERIVSMTEMCKRFGCNRTTIMRKMRAGKFPQRRTFPDGTKGWLVSEVDNWLARGLAGEDDDANAARISRITRH